MKTVSVNELVPNTYYSMPVYLDDKYIILSPDTPVTSELINRLTAWNYRHVYTDGECTGESAAGRQEESDSPPSQSPAYLEQDQREKEKLEAAQKSFERLLEFTERYFAGYVKNGELPIDPLTAVVKEAIQTIKGNRSSILRITGAEVSGKNYLVVHSTKTLLLALTVGMFLKLPQHRLIELGIAAVVHEIGMIRLPPHLYMAPRGLTPQEKKAIMTHPILGYNILKGAMFPVSISSSVLEHHERMNGSGYPRAITGEKISQYARILAVCCSYDALISKRPYREAQDGHVGILNLLKDRGVQYDEQVLRALVFSLSIFPLGSYVHLSNDMRGIVVETNQLNPRFPVVKLIAGGDNSPLKDPLVIQTEEDGYHIQRILSPEETEALKERLSQSRND